VSHPGPVEAVLRQIRAVRRRNNLSIAQHACAVWVAVAAAAAAGVVLAALRAGGVAFLIVALIAAAVLCGVTTALARRVAREWMPARDAPARIDAARALRGRVVSVMELDGTARGDLFDLLVRQNLDALPDWRAEDVVPEVVPARAFACAAAALSVLALVVVLAPKLRPPPPRIVVGDRRMDFVLSEQARAGAERLLVAPGTEHLAPERGAAGAAHEAPDTHGLPAELADASAAFQDWLQRTLGVEERWETSEQVPASRRQDASPPSRRERGAAARPVAGDGAPMGGSEEQDADGAASHRPSADHADAGEPGGGGAGAGAGSDTDPALYGAPHDEPVAGGDRFELAIAARVRTRRGAAMEPWTTAPEPDGDRRPVLAAQQRAEQPGHRMPVPASFAPLVRRLFTHPAGRGAP
jgi:hypothetical protein